MNGREAPMFSKSMLRMIATLAGVGVKFQRNGGAHLFGPLPKLEAIRNAAIRSRLLGDMRLITEEKRDGVDTGNAPRIEIHPSLVVK